MPVEAVAAIVIVLVIAAVGIIVASCIFSYFFTRVSYPKYSPQYGYDYYSGRSPEKFRRRPVSFYSGKNKLQGYVYGDRNTAAKGLIVLAHGIGKGHMHFLKEIEYFLDHGWKVLAYDATGSCESEGKSTVGLVQSALDLRAALSFALSDGDLSKYDMCLFGHSWGGYAVTAVLNFPEETKKVRAAASVSGYNSPVHMTMAFAKTHVGVFTTLLYPAAWLHYRMLHGKYGNITAAGGIDRAGIPVRVYHAENDKLIKIDETSIYNKRAKIKNPNAEFIKLTGKYMDGHSTIFRNPADAEYMENVWNGFDEITNSYKTMKKEVPDSVAEAYYAKVDKSRCSHVNEKLIGEIEEFFSAKIGDRK